MNPNEKRCPNHCQRRTAIALLGLASMLLTSCAAGPAGRDAATLPGVIVITNFNTFQHQDPENGQSVLLSPEYSPPHGWDELVLSWNAVARQGAGIKLEARARFPDRTTDFYTMGLWSQDPARYPRRSIKGQKDADGEVRTDTLVLRQPAASVQVRLTLTHDANGRPPEIRLLAISHLNSQDPAVPRPANRAAWGRRLAVPERSQLGHSEGEGWCSPTSVSMVLAYWAEVLKRPELNVSVPEAARAVHDPGWGGTGNWAFNTAFPGSFDDMQAMVIRLPDLRAVEDLIARGVPPVASVSLDLLRGGKRDLGNGHLVVCTGFTTEGDVITNDPWAHLDEGETVRRVYSREVFVKAWNRSRFTVYLIGPDGTGPPTPGR